MTSLESTAEHANGRVREVVDQYTADGPYVPRLAATEIVAKLRQTEPEVLAAWLDAQAEHFVWQLINDRDRSRRGRAVHVAKSSVFREANEAVEQGDAEPLRRAFLDMPLTVADGSRRPLAQLRKDDLLFVASDYGRRARENGMREAFVAALAKKVGRGTVADRFAEDQLARLWSSIAG